MGNNPNTPQSTKLHWQMVNEPCCEQTLLECAKTYKCILKRMDEYNVKKIQHQNCKYILVNGNYESPFNWIHPAIPKWLLKNFTWIKIKDSICERNGFKETFRNRNPPGLRNWNVKNSLQEALGPLLRIPTACHNFFIWNPHTLQRKPLVWNIFDRRARVLGPQW